MVTYICVSVEENHHFTSECCRQSEHGTRWVGEKTIIFSKGGNSEHVHGKILEAYPDLASVGRYQILRSGERENRQLMVIPILPGGYTVNYLKTTLTSAKGYLCPFQKDITPVLDHGNVAGSVQSQVSCSFLVF